MVDQIEDADIFWHIFNHAFRYAFGLFSEIVRGFTRQCYIKLNDYVRITKIRSAKVWPVKYI